MLYDASFLSGLRINFVKRGPVNSPLPLIFPFLAWPPNTLYRYHRPVLSNGYEITEYTAGVRDRSLSTSCGCIQSGGWYAGRRYTDRIARKDPGIVIL